MPGLRADYAWHARCLPASHAAHTRWAAVAHPWPPMAQAWPRRRTGLVWAPPRRNVLTGGKIFREYMAGKLL